MKNAEDMICDAETAVEASYKKGFGDGYGAAAMVVQSVVEAIKNDPAGYDLDSIMQGLNKATERAYEFMGCPPELKKMQVRQGPKRE